MTISSDVDDNRGVQDTGGPNPYESAYRQIFEWSRCGTAHLGADGHIRHCNRALEEFLGYSKAELSSMPLSVFVYPDDATSDVNLFAAMLDGKHRGYTVEKRFVRKDGRIVCGRVSIAPAEVPDQGPVLIQIVDVTAERRIRDERHKMLHDLRERIKEANAIHDAAALMLDDRLGIESVLRRIAGLLPPAMQYPEVAAVKVWYGEVVVTTPGMIEEHSGSRAVPQLYAPIRTRDGTSGGMRLVYVADRPDADEGPFLVEERRLVDSLADMISAMIDRRMSDVALERTNQHLKLAQTVANVGIWEWEQKRDRITWSEQLEAIAGLAPGSFAGTFSHFISLVHPSDRAAVELAIREAIENLANDDRFAAEYRLCRPDRTTRWVASTGRVFRDEDGVPVRMLGMAHDITAMRELERRIQETQKMDALGRLAGGVAHDFNNLLSVIRGYADFIGAALPEDSPVKDDLNEIIDATDRATALTRQLLTFSRRQATEPRVVSPNVLIGGMEKLLRRLLTADVIFSVEPGPEELRVRVDPAQLEQVILNLVVNARDAMPGSGELTVSIGAAEFDEPVQWEHAALDAGRYVMINVSDTGTGMTEDTRRRLFEPFFTTKEAGRGTGLGLATVYGIVQQSGGGIWVYSEPGMGSTFKVYLPLTEDQLEPVRKRELDARPVSGTETILVVDDDIHLRALAERALRANGYTVFSAADGVEALRIMEGNDLRPDLLLTDIVMPRMRGPALASEVRRRVPTTRLVFVTGYNEDAIGTDELPGAYRLVQKPFAPRELLRTVRHTLDG